MKIEKFVTTKKIYIDGKEYNSRKICLEDFSNFASYLRRNRISDALQACKESGVAFKASEIVRELSGEISDAEVQEKMATLNGVIFLASCLIENYQQGLINDSNMESVLEQLMPSGEPEEKNGVALTDGN